MRPSRCSSQFHLKSSKSNNTSITSILRHSSTDRKKRTASVRFEDDFIEPEEHKTVNFPVKTEVVNRLRKTVSSGSHQKLAQNFNKTRKIDSENKKELEITGSVKDCEVKVAEGCKFIPKVISYSFRNSGFYDKLKKFYANDQRKSEVERVFIKLNVEEKGSEKNEEAEKGRAGSGSIKKARERSCAVGKDAKGLARRVKSQYSHNILN